MCRWVLFVVFSFLDKLIHCFFNIFIQFYLILGIISLRTNWFLRCQLKKKKKITNLAWMKVHNLDTIDSHKSFTKFDCPEYIMFGNIWRIPKSQRPLPTSPVSTKSGQWSKITRGSTLWDTLPKWSSQSLETKVLSMRDIELGMESRNQVKEAPCGT